MLHERLSYPQGIHSRRPADPSDGTWMVEIGGGVEEIVHELAAKQLGI
ncbi:hypothetical protein [Limnohabitans sp.]|jgi:hypothetical protein